jgi:uncharacterized protein (DUF2141 family)
MIGRSRLLLVVGIACGAAAAAQTPVRDNTRVAAGTASISGTVVVNDAAKQPARRVRVTLTNVAGTPPGQTTTTDDGGAFTFRGLAAGKYELQAFKPAYLRASYGASRPDRVGTPIVVKDGEAVANVSMTIARGGVITGIVRDAGGRPVPGLNVRVLKLGYNAVTGERTLGAPSTGSVGLTDDRGEYRAYGLPPGGYLVIVVPSVPSGRGNDDIRQLTAAEVRQALQVARAGTSTATVKPGQPTLPLSASSHSGRVNYAPIFHPGVTDIGAAAPIALGVSEERAGVDVAIQLVPTATISGTISSPAGALPQSLSVRLVPAGPQTELLAAAGLRGLFAQPRPDGTYVFTSVAPGAYTIKAIIGGGRGAAPNTPTQWAAADVIVSGQDLDVPLTLQPGVAVNGRVVFEGSQPTAAEVQALSFVLVPPGSGGQVQASGGGRVDAEGRFTFAGVTPDMYRFLTTWNAPAARDKWSIKASTANGREAFEAPLRVSPNETVDWTVTYTDKPTNLTGVFQDRSGRAATEYYILVFSSDRKHWIPGSRRVRMTRPSTDGAFSVKGLPPGEYFLAALADLETGEWNDPTLLEELVKSSAKVTLRDGEETKQDFRIGG